MQVHWQNSHIRKSIACSKCQAKGAYGTGDIVQVLEGDMGFGLSTGTGSGIYQSLGTRVGLAKMKTMVMQLMLEVFWQCTILQGCAVRKIEGGPRVCACEIPDAQKIISMKKLGFSGCLGAKVRCQRPVGTVIAQTCSLFLVQKLWVIKLLLCFY